MTDQWHKVGRRSDLDEDEPIAAKIGDRDIGVFLVEGNLYAIDNECPHAFAMLTDGFSDGFVARCPMHKAEFDIRTGHCLLGPGKGAVDLPALAVHEVKLEGGDVFVKLAP